MTTNASEDRSEFIDLHWQNQRGWVNYALGTLEIHCRNNHFVSVADVWPKVPCPRNKSSMGAVIREAIRRRWIEEEVVSGAYVLAIDPVLLGSLTTSDGDPVDHKNLLKVFRSRLYRGGDASAQASSSRRVADD